MPKVRGVYQDSKGSWYFKVRTDKDPLTGKWQQVTRRGFSTAAAAGREREALVSEAAKQSTQGTASGLTVAELVEQYLDDAEAADRLSPKTLFDYRHYLEDYIRPWIGNRLARELDSEAVASWQRSLATEGGTKTGRGLAPNTIRLARAPVNGAFKQAVATGVIANNPLGSIPKPRARKKIPQHWSPEQARHFLAMHEGDRLFPVWAFLLGSGLRIGELVHLRWPNVDVESGLVRINEFASVLGYEVKKSSGKSNDAIRTIDIDSHLVGVLETQRNLQTNEQQAADYLETDFVFTKTAGGAYHPQYLSRLLGRISPEVGLPRLTAHGLRHTSATLMLASGVAPKVAAERLGHADASLFSNLYSHVTPTMQREAATRIGEALFGD
ncbi:MAG: integrase [Acidimicrobiales bacterium]|jgi:integrase